MKRCVNKTPKIPPKAVRIKYSQFSRVALYKIYIQESVAFFQKKKLSK